MHKKVFDDVQKSGRELRKLIPDVYAGFSALSTAALADGEVSKATKELIAIAIAVTRQCDGCIAAHAHTAVMLGVSRQQVAEAIGVAILMNGGPGTVYGPRALAAFDEFSAEHGDSTAEQPPHSC